MEVNAHQEINRCALTRLNRVKVEALGIREMAESVRDDFISGADYGQSMQSLRDSAENLLQCVHEFNAYANAAAKAKA